MALPVFYHALLTDHPSLIVLDEDTSKHVVQVLRMKSGATLQLTDGKGKLMTAQITDAHKKHCTVQPVSFSQEPAPLRNVTVAISLLKNPARFEWFLEKATELGVTEIVPLLCERTERSHFRFERMQGIVISAMLQSQQSWLPLLQEPIAFTKWVEQTSATLNTPGNRKAAMNLIAHCEAREKTQLADIALEADGIYKICIGPEGDFSPSEIEFALHHQFVPVALGDQRLRTETAGMTSSVLLCLN